MILNLLPFQSKMMNFLSFSQVVFPINKILTIHRSESVSYFSAFFHFRVTFNKNVYIVKFKVSTIIIINRYQFGENPPKKSRQTEMDFRRNCLHFCEYQPKATIIVMLLILKENNRKISIELAQTKNLFLI